MLADAADAALFQHDDLIGVEDGAHPLSDDDHRGVPRLSLERGPQHRIGLEIQSREAVVKDVDVGLLDDRPGDGKPLSLSAGDVRAPLGDRLVQSL